MKQLLLLLLAASLGQCQRRKIQQLPYVTFSPQFEQYSGYLRGLDGRQLFYWLVEASETPPSKSPLLLWLNGGPGCSSVGGLLMSNGPFLADDSARLVRHELAWNRQANVLYLDSPAGTGLSQPLPQLSADVLNDNYTVEAKLQALLHFYELFPEYRGRQLFLAGESYAGVYIPMLAVAILHRPEYPAELNLTAVAVGNGLHVPHNDTLMEEEQQKYDSVMGMNMNFSHLVNGYNCAKPCYNVGPEKNTYPCLNSTGLSTFLNDPEVRRALGVHPAVPEYFICNDTIVKNFQQRDTNVLPELLRLVEANVRVMLYHGHLDKRIPVGVTQQLLSESSSGLKQDQQFTDSWFYCRNWTGVLALQVAGEQRNYAGGRLIHRTVIGAGHLVATDLPEAADQILRDLLNYNKEEANMHGNFFCE